MFLYIRCKRLLTCYIKLIVSWLTMVQFHLTFTHYVHFCFILVQMWSCWNFSSQSINTQMSSSCVPWLQHASSNSHNSDKFELRWRSNISVFRYFWFIAPFCLVNVLLKNSNQFVCVHTCMISTLSYQVCFLSIMLLFLATSAVFNKLVWLFAHYRNKR